MTATNDDCTCRDIFADDCLVRPGKTGCLSCLNPYMRCQKHEPEPEPVASSATEGSTASPRDLTPGQSLARSPRPEAATEDLNRETSVEDRPAPKQSAPRPKVQTRPPDSQNEHDRCYSTLPDLTVSDRWLAHTMAKLCYMQESPPSDYRREMTPEYLAIRARMPLGTVRDSTRRLVKQGLFERVDNGRGGRNHSNRATYKPTLPKHWQPRNVSHSGKGVG